MKKLLIAGVALVTVLALAGCGANTYSNGRVKTKAEEGATKTLSSVTGAEASIANSDMYSIEVTGAQAAGYGIDVENILGAGYTNSLFEKLGIAVAIAKDSSVAVLYISFETADEQIQVPFTATGTITNNATSGFSFTATEASGVSVLVLGTKFGSQIMLTSQISNALPFAKSTPLTVVVNN